jgi:glycerophosphoryl diester phosphodiesterase
LIKYVEGINVDEIKKYDVGRLKPNTRYSRRYPEQQPADGQRIPGLGEVISMMESKCDPANQLWVEIKTNPEKPHLTPAPASVADAVVKLLRELDFTRRAHILSFDWRRLTHIQKIALDIPTVYLSLVGRGLNNIKPGQPGPSPWMAGYDIDDFQGSIIRQAPWRFLLNTCWKLKAFRRRISDAAGLKSSLFNRKRNCAILA